MGTAGAVSCRELVKPRVVLGRGFRPDGLGTGPMMRLLAALALVVASTMIGPAACSDDGDHSSLAELALGTDWTYDDLTVHKDPGDGTFAGALSVTNLTGDHIRAIVTLTIYPDAGQRYDCPGPRIAVLSAPVTLDPDQTEYVVLASTDRYGEARCLDIDLTPLSRQP